MATGPLTGVKVIDWTIWQQGPICSMILGDMGADVIKLESPDGDPGRGLLSISRASTNLKGGVNAYFEANNRNKRGIVLDLKKAEAREVVYKLVRDSDVFVQNYRKGVAERLGMGYETLKERNPGLIYAWCNGFGPEGPEADRPAFDMIAQGRSGFMYASVSLGGDPRGVETGISDQMGGTVLALGVLGALCARASTYGQGQKVEVSLLGSMVWLQGLGLAQGLLTKGWRPSPDRKTAANPMYNYYHCKDGRWFELMNLQQDRYWVDFCRILGRPSLASDPRFADTPARAKNAAELIAILDQIFLTRTYDEWKEELLKADMVFGHIQRLSELEHDPQIIANQYITETVHPTVGPIKVPNHPVRYSGTPAGISSAAPELGQHTEEVLIERLGYTWEEIEKLRDAGAIL